MFGYLTFYFQSRYCVYVYRFILPLGFAHNFKEYSLLELKKEPQIIRDLIKQELFRKQIKVIYNHDCKKFL